MGFRYQEKKTMNSGSISYLVRTINGAIRKTFAKAHDLRKINILSLGLEEFLLMKLFVPYSGIIRQLLFVNI